MLPEDPLFNHLAGAVGSVTHSADAQAPAGKKILGSFRAGEGEVGRVEEQAVFGVLHQVFRTTDLSDIGEIDLAGIAARGGAGAVEDKGVVLEAGRATDQQIVSGNGEDPPGGIDHTLNAVNTRAVWIQEREDRLVVWRGHVRDMHFLVLLSFKDGADDHLLFGDQILKAGVKENVLLDLISFQLLRFGRDLTTVGSLDVTPYERVDGAFGRYAHALGELLLDQSDTFDRESGTDPSTRVNEPTNLVDRIFERLLERRWPDDDGFSHHRMADSQPGLVSVVTRDRVSLSDLKPDGVAAALPTYVPAYAIRSTCEAGLSGSDLPRPLCLSCFMREIERRFVGKERTGSAFRRVSNAATQPRPAK